MVRFTNYFYLYFIQTTDVCAKYVPSNLKITLNESFQCCNNYYSATSFLFFMTLQTCLDGKLVFRSFVQNHQIKSSRKVVTTTIFLLSGKGTDENVNDFYVFK